MDDVPTCPSGDDPPDGRSKVVVGPEGHHPDTSDGDPPVLVPFGQVTDRVGRQDLEVDALREESRRDLSQMLLDPADVRREARGNLQDAQAIRRTSSAGG